jgi:hypothetical protein
MASAHTSPTATTTTTFEPIRAGKWIATMQTADGPVIAIGDSIGEAQAALDALLEIATRCGSLRR